MVQLYPESCILVELCIGRVLFGRDVNVPSSSGSHLSDPLVGIFFRRSYTEVTDRNQ